MISLKLLKSENEALNILSEEIKTLRARIAELEAAQRWIPVAEQIPEENEEGYLICNKDYVYKAWIEEGIFRDAEGFSISATHWRPLPEPPKEDER